MAIGSLEQRRKNKPHRSGIIRLGYKKETQNGKQYPVEAPHFVLTDAPELKEFYGEEPTSLDIVFTSNDIDQIARTYLQMYKCDNPSETDPSKRKNWLACIGQGVNTETGEPTMAFWYDTRNPPPSGGIPLNDEMRALISSDIDDLKERLDGLPPTSRQSRMQIQRDLEGRMGMLTNGRPAPRQCWHEQCPDFQAGRCKAILTLCFKVPLGNVFGEYVLRSGSLYAMQNVLNCLDDVRETIRVASGGKMSEGMIAGVPMRLYRKRQQTKFIGPDGRQQFGEHYILHLDVNHEFKAKFQSAVGERLSALMLEPPPALLSLSPALPGATLIDQECPDDLYPTEEERLLAESIKIREQEAQAVAAQAQQAVLDDKAAWAQTPEVADRMTALEKAKGRPWPLGKRVAFVQRFGSLEGVIDELDRLLGRPDGSGEAAGAGGGVQPQPEAVSEDTP